MLNNRQGYNGTLKFLGRSSAFGSNGNTAAYFIEEDGYSKTFNLIDCGYDVYEKLIHKFDFSEFNRINVFITHLHPDHAGSLGQLIFYIYFVHHKKVNVISQCREIERYLRICGVTREKYYRYNYSTHIFSTPHFPRIDSYGFVLQIKDKRVIYTGDTCSLDTIETMLIVFDRVDELYTEASVYGGVHLSIADNLEKLLKIQEKGTKVYLMHLDDEEAIAKITNNKLEFVEIE